MKYVDMELQEPITGDLYQVQVKSDATIANFREYAKKFVTILEKKKVQVRSIVRSGRTTKETRNKKNKYIDMDVESPVVTNIFNNKIAIIIWSEIPEVILIENENAAKSYKEFFEFMWKNAKTNSKKSK